MPTPQPAPRCPVRAWPCPDEHTGALAALLIARRSAVKARTAALNQIKAMLVTAPAELRERYRQHTTNTTLIGALVRSGSPTGRSDHDRGADRGQALAQRVTYLQTLERDLTTHLHALVAERTLPAGPPRGRPRHRGPTDRHRRHQPRAAAQRGRLRRAVRRGPGARLLRQDASARKRVCIHLRK